MTADLQEQAYVSEVVLYMALELSNGKWRLALGRVPVPRKRMHDGVAGRELARIEGGRGTVRARPAVLGACPRRRKHTGNRQLVACSWADV